MSETAVDPRNALTCITTIPGKNAQADKFNVLRNYKEFDKEFSSFVKKLKNRILKKDMNVDFLPIPSLILKTYLRCFINEISEEITGEDAAKALATEVNILLEKLGKVFAISQQLPKTVESMMLLYSDLFHNERTFTKDKVMELSFDIEVLQKEESSEISPEYLFSITIHVGFEDFEEGDEDDAADNFIAMSLMTFTAEENDSEEVANTKPTI